MSEPVELRVAGHTVTISNPDKVFFTTRNDTKLDLTETWIFTASKPVKVTIGGCGG